MVDRDSGRPGDDGEAHDRSRRKLLQGLLGLGVVVVDTSFKATLFAGGFSAARELIGRIGRELQRTPRELIFDAAHNLRKKFSGVLSDKSSRYFEVGGVRVEVAIKDGSRGAKGDMLQVYRRDGSRETLLVHNDAEKGTVEIDYAHWFPGQKKR